MQYILNGRKHEICLPRAQARHHFRWVMEQGGTVFWTYGA
jgi:hypothetical protein